MLLLERCAAPAAIESCASTAACLDRGILLTVQRELTRTLLTGASVASLLVFGFACSCKATTTTAATAPASGLEATSKSEAEGTTPLPTVDRLVMTVIVADLYSFAIAANNQRNTSSAGVEFAFQGCSTVARLVEAKALVLE